MKYSQVIEYKCGHSFVAEIESNVPIDKTRYVNTLCRDCRIKQGQKALSLDSLVKSIPALRARSDKQKEYAEKNRMNFIKYWVKAASDTQADTIKKIIEKEDDAGWWMDNYKIAQTDDFIKTYVYSPKRKKTPTVKLTIPANNNAYLKEATIKPDILGCKTLIQNLIYVYGTDEMIVIVPAKIDTCLNDILYKYTIKDGAYVRQITEFTGSYIDRATESSLTLLKQGYPIIIHDDQIRKQILKGIFTPEPNRWLKYIDDNYAMITWDGYDRKLCTQALALIPGARWNDKYQIITVPLKNNAQHLINFAKKNNFAIQSKLTEILYSHKD